MYQEYFQTFLHSLLKKEKHEEEMIYESLMRNSKEEEKLTIFSCMSWDGKPKCEGFFWSAGRVPDCMLGCFYPIFPTANNVIPVELPA